MNLVKSLVKPLLACTLLLLAVACSNKDTAQNNTSANSASSSPTTANAPSDSGSPSAVSSPGSKNASGSTAQATKIDATLKEMTIQLSSKTAPAGPVEFVVKNSGKIPHEFVVLKDDLKGKKLPLKGDKLDEDAKGLKNIGEIDEDKLKSGVTQTLNVNLTPGRYLIVCNVGKHFKMGMKTELTVK